MTSAPIVVFCLAMAVVASAETETLFGGFRFAKKMYDQCGNNPSMFKCLKIQALKIADRALQSRSFSLIEGISVVREEKEGGRSFQDTVPLSAEKLDKLPSDQIDDLLVHTMGNFLSTHRVQIDLPHLVEEGRGKKGKNMGPLLALMAIKGSFMAIAFKGIAAMAGTALIVGKIALILSAVLGLKKLLSSGHEKTTFEIVKIPQHTQSHTYSNSYEDDGHYHRSLAANDELGIQQRAYRGYKYAN